MTALVVDDNPINLMFLEEMLGGYGVAAHTAESGAEALGLAADTAFDAVFLDYLMPGMDGLETCRGLREIPGFGDVPIIMVTASEPETVARLTGVTDCLLKPVEPEDLDKVMLKWLNLKPLSEGPSDGRDGALAALDGVVDVNRGLELLKGGHEAYLKMLRTYCRQIRQKEGQMAGYVSGGDMKAYAVEAHSLKSSLNLIGAPELSERAKALEIAADRGRGFEGHDAFMRGALELADRIGAALAGPEDGAKPAGELKTLAAALKNALGFMDEFETEDARGAIRGARSFGYGGEYDGPLEELDNMLEDFDYEGFTANAAELLSLVTGVKEK